MQQRMPFMSQLVLYSPYRPIRVAQRDTSLLLWVFVNGVLGSVYECERDNACCS